MQKFFQCLLVAVFLVTAKLGIAKSEPFPTKPIQVIIASTPGSASDVITRFLGKEVSKQLGQPIVVVSKPSASGTIAADYSRRAPADGHTLFFGSNTSMAANVHLVKNLSYDPLRDFEPIAQVSINPLVLVVRSDLPIKSVAELVAYAKARPGQMNYGVGNSGALVSSKLLQSITGISAQEITFKGASQAMLELVAGRLDFMITDPLVVDPFIRQGAVRPLAVTSSVRLPSMSEVPTMVEAGVPGYDYASWLGYYAPRGTPKEVVEKLNAAFVKAVQSDEGKEFFNRMGMIARSSTPQALTEFNKGQIASWERWVKVSGLQPQ
ncbi:Bug family tripartite tricarboxylate transporter substrate binding protein [Noviherbaspirillum sedimenti]|uniref:Tripartite tricarboxylate transporter substrate binding protein n=1 Tax=Noviherbaspirillum sedimenti TaxID=2320865 RepID=A0A3A3G6P5_9BURK|nr:tripartite tricarboxylate transporter substrate binding protein [Noviherbaspirillum sedimenti]RJG03315.1 tripartite tricarboxylate transporter substrate binding protein [Noviherbaspirillum sedimenti]